MGSTEIWKHVWGFSRYMVSNMGRVKSRENGLFVVQSPSKDGHMTVVLVDNQQRRFVKRVERVVMEAFDWQSGDYSQIIHIDNDRTNCRYSNLQRVYDTDSVTDRRREPLIESRYIGIDDEGNEVPAARTSPRSKTPKRRLVRQPATKQEGINAREEKKLSKPKPVLPPLRTHTPVRVRGTTHVYSTVSEMCRDLDLDHSTVSKMLRGKTGQKTYKGLTFEYAEKVDEVVVAVDSAKRERRIARPIRHIESGRVFSSQNDAARKLNLSQPLISQILLGKRKHHAGYTFEYVDD